MDVKINELFDGEQVSCGGLASLKPSYPEIAILTVQSYNYKADMLVSYCPFCVHHMKGACKSKEEELKIKDASVLLTECVLGCNPRD